MFTVKGEFTVKGRVFSFTRKVSAENEKSAKEKVLSLVGSNHRAKRHLIRILEVINDK